MKTKQSKTKKRTKAGRTASLRCDAIVSRLLGEIPTNWCDPLLTGPDAALSGDGGTWGGHDIERLLGRIRENMVKAADTGYEPRDCGEKLKP